MSEPVCPICDSKEHLEYESRYECVVCGHEWAKEETDEPEQARVVKDAHGNVLADGDIVAMVKDIKLGGTSDVLKTGTKSKPIRLVEGDHEISCKMNGVSIALKACYVKKVTEK
ncbi:zinc ribbon domain-containing protein YjdM [Luteolibacter sp. LG18]|uniref:zinc ribbon domain-containing protein YjdM n=1 Tax=Luteolibacter sp. LG18 TaxID=2819286 RepID=UPI002B324683|nr:alkylphosphonate utilization protein [Luteolibacter sp. LG18]